ncbi:MAG: DUF2924 domain-containing protein [Candidatus Omnitrophota bacterium]
MKEHISEEIQALKDASLAKTQSRYKELYAAEAPCVNKPYLIKKIAYKLQEMAEGGFSDEAKMRIIELIEKYDPINNKALRPQVVSAGKNVVSIPFMRDKRLPIPGSVIHKKYKDQDIHVKVLDKGFEYRDKYYKSLSAIAFELTGAHWNGFSFFNL